MASFEFAATLLFFSLSLCFLMTSANVVLIGSNVSLSFPSLQANFAPSIKSSGIFGVLYVAEPIDACSELSNEVKIVSKPFLLIVRGGCGFDEKVRRAQHSGFKAAVIYDDHDSGVLISMAGNPTGVKIPAVFVTKSTGETLKKYAGSADSELWLIPTFENSAWSIMAISFISLLAMSAMLATCFFVRRHRIRRERPLAPRVREFHGMSKRLVKAMPSLIFTSVLEDNCTSSTCAICLEDYSVGDRLRVLPCRHKFHAFCVDSWLTMWRTFCPVCKRDARTSTGEPPASESTPLLSSNASSIASSSVLSSFRSTTSSAIPIDPAASSRSTSISHIPSLSGASLLQQPIHSSYRQSSPLSVSRSSADLRRMSSQRSVTSHLFSPHSIGYPSISPLNSRYMSPYIPSASNGSTSYLIGSSGRPPHPLRCSESAASFSPYASAHSLPES